MLFSILTTCYNQEKTIGATLKSCLSQTFTDYEIVISDDGSTDRSEEIISSFSDARIRTFKQKTNLKEYPNRNFLVQNAKGDYVIFIDAEDILYPHALEVYAYYIKLFPEAGMILTHAWDERIIYPLKLSPHQLYQFAFLDNGALFGGNFTNVLFKRDALIKAGLFRTDIKSGDTYMLFKLALTQSALVINGDLAWWRKSTGNATEKLNPHYSAKDYSHLANTINYKIAMLDNITCPLNKDEIEIAKINIYGGCLRILFRWLITFKFSKIFYLLKGLNIPAKYFKAFFTPAKRDFFKNYSGNNPLTSFLAD
jgi:glycosyltransferase involved in cell wall biosynthesis